LKVEKGKKLEEHIKIIKDDLEKAWKITKEEFNLMCKKMKNRIKFDVKKVPKFEKGQLILLKTRNEKLMKTKDKSLNSKLSNRNIGPYEIKEIDENNHAIIQITPSKTVHFHLNDLVHYDGDFQPFPNGCFAPSLNEIIKIKIPDPRGPVKGEKLIPDKEKNKLNLKSIVGRRVNVLWKANKKYYKGTVIGYTSNLTHNLIFFDEPTISKDNEIVDVKEDYYQMQLFKSSPNSKVETWSLLSE